MVLRDYKCISRYYGGFEQIIGHIIIMLLYYKGISRYYGVFMQIIGHIIYISYESMHAACILYCALTLGIFNHVDSNQNCTVT